MQGGVFTQVGRIESRDLPIPQPQRGEVLLKVAGCGVCGTDHHIFDGELTRGVAPPVVLGHEIATRIEAVGPDVDGLTPGQFCAVDPVIGCGVCPACRSAQPNLCNNTTTIGYKLNGGFAQFLTAPARNVVPLDESVGIAGAVLCETLACVLNGYDRLEFAASSSALILGAGTVGLLWAQVLANSPCRKLIQTEPVDYRRDKAAQLGADLVLDPDADALSARVRRDLPDGVDFIIDATGSADAITQALPLLAPAGTLMIFGVCPAHERVQLSPYDLYEKEAKIIASKMPPNTLERSARLIESGRIACDQIVTATRPLGALADAVAGFVDNRQSQIKVAIDPWA
ncbi:MAG: hypothetical protein CMJ49_02805 [Planctomycetaceae bacterium]|nr:hypothetical protein [Planctomycetaceae bacterium]